MSIKKLPDSFVKTYVDILISSGEEGLYQRVVGMGVMRYAAKIKEPEVELLDLSESFFVAFRRTGDERLFIVGKVFRRAAHTLYRKLYKVTSEKNSRFLRAV